MSSEDIATDVSQHQAEQQSIPVQQQQEKMIPQSKVDAIIAAKLAAEREQMRASMGGMQQQPSQPQGFDKEALLKEAVEMMKAREEEQRAAYEREQQQAQVDEIARNYLEKMEQGKHKYEDFEQVTKSFNPGKYAGVTILAAQQDNLADIIYDLKKNPQKLTHLHVLALTDPDEAREEMARLSESIKKNEQALISNVKSPSPLSKLKPSAQAGQDTGKRTISDLRKDPRYRG